MAFFKNYFINYKIEKEAQICRYEIISPNMAMTPEQHCELILLMCLFV